MRSIYSVLIFLLASELVFAKGVLNEKITVTQARGLKEGSCYREVAALSCEKDCVLDFFPTTQAQLSLAVQEISTHDRKKLGRFFDVLFRFSKKNSAKIYSLNPITIEQLQKKMDKSAGYFNQIPCNIAKTGK